MPIDPVLYQVRAERDEARAEVERLLDSTLAKLDAQSAPREQPRTAAPIQQAQHLRLIRRLVETACWELEALPLYPEYESGPALESLQHRAPQLEAHLAQHPEVADVLRPLLHRAKTIVQAQPEPDPRQLELPLGPEPERAKPAKEE